MVISMGTVKLEHNKTDSGLHYQYNHNVNNSLYIVLQMKVFQRQRMVEDTESLLLFVLFFS
jgi:hypothetical protein